MPKFIPKYRKDNDYDDEEYVKFIRKKKNKHHQNKNNNDSYEYDYFDAYDNDYQKTSRKKAKFY